MQQHIHVRNGQRQEHLGPSLCSTKGSGLCAVMQGLAIVLSVGNTDIILSWNNLWAEAC